MDVFGKVVEVVENATIAKNGGGSYKGTRLTYRDSSDGALKDRNIHENALKFNPSLKEMVHGLKSGDDFTMTIEKEGEFWNIKNIVKGNVPTVAAAKPAVQGASATPKSTYQTAEERAQTQVYIVRQSSITQAIAWFNLANLKPNDPPEIKDVIEVAKQFEAHVFSQATGMDAIMSMQNDIV